MHLRQSRVIGMEIMHSQGEETLIVSVVMGRNNRHRGECYGRPFLPLLAVARVRNAKK